MNNLAKQDTRLNPVKPVNRKGYQNNNMDTCSGQCPNCMDVVVNIVPRSKKINYCKNCGQAINWNL